MPRLDDYDPSAQQNGLQIKKRTATGASLAATCNGFAGSVTTESLTTAAGAEATYTITNNKVKADSVVLVSIGNGTNTTLGAAVVSVTPAAGSFVVTITNVHAVSALDGTLEINFLVI
ncbi:hypothetical protein [Caudoviricetes sp.]|nr:hypothetical protein [Caudoviricetes sp.]